MYCPNCGTQLPDDARFCAVCGTELNNTEEPVLESAYDGSEQEPENTEPIEMPEISSEDLTGSGKNPMDGNQKKGIIAAAALAVVVLLFFAGYMVLGRSKDTGDEVQQASANEAADDVQETLADTEAPEDTDEADLLAEEEEPEEEPEPVYDPTEGGIHRYEYIVSDATWEQAFADCISRGGYLARINSMEEYHYILNEINQRQLAKVHFALGGRRMSGSQEYYWVDTDGMPYGEQINTGSYWCAGEWMSGEPSYMDGELEEMYLDIFYYEREGRWVWNDVPNDIVSVVPSYSGKLGYICEYE